MSNSLVSIIIPCFNAEKFVAEAIQSALDQTYAHCEVIVIDDGSTDKSLDVIKSFGDKIRWETGPNRGGCAARNRGIKLSRGSLLKFFDADDVLANDVVELQVDACEDYPETVIHGPWQFLTFSEGLWKPKKCHLSIDPQKDMLMQWLEGVYVVPHAFLWPRSIIEKIHGWNESLQANQDGDLFYRAFLSGARFHKLTLGVVYYRKDSVMTSNSVSQRRSEESLRSSMMSLDNVKSTLSIQGKLEEYHRPLGLMYWRLARTYALTNLPLVEECEVLGKFYYKAIPGTWLHRISVSILGLRLKEIAAIWFRRLAKKKPHV